MRKEIEKKIMNLASENGSSDDLFNLINSISYIKKMIKNGDAENQYLECKSPQHPRLYTSLKSELAQIVSSFCNSGGGIILWGISTTKHQHSRRDILNSIEPIGYVNEFAKEVNSTIPTLVTPEVNFQSKTIKKKPDSQDGLLVTYIKPTKNDPVQVINDGKFYIRINEEIKIMPYEVIKRMFSGEDSPDLVALLDEKRIKKNDQGFWILPVIISNKSSKAAKDVTVAVSLEKRSGCAEIISSGFRDSSDINPGKKIFIIDLSKVIHRGMNIIAGDIKIKIRQKGKPILSITVYSADMRPRAYSYTIDFANNKFSIKDADSFFLY
ncbi:hypothetical protein A2V71_02615 [Candidatus Berkelbacteria bacterium RBG_13_40_8]|uniref:Schlafen AlbA-2 domain-containing protein n=1 Tax=Candidatus Berkelbacteria bacterium RBG_13_40_8 TaxID=1797467 RepID=A0A1F5DPN3_9BACT|nr:MAG: hypothetical protein A2V71_02615 [Candidatus Berkelbacteria bacterium RBG_13_40_8]